MDIPDDIIQAIEERKVSKEQLRRLIEIEATELGLTGEEAIAAARANQLPINLIGSDIEFLVELLSDFD